MRPAWTPSSSWPTPAPMTRPDPSWRPSPPGASGPDARGSSPTCPWWCRSPGGSRPPGCPWATWSRRATWACCGRWRSSTGARGSSSRPMPPGGSARRSPRPHPRLHELLGREPTDDELAVELDMPTDKVVRLKDTAQAITSLDTPVGEDGAALADFLEDDSAAAPDELALETVGREALEQALNALPARERQVLILRFGLDSG